MTTITRWAAPAKLNLFLYINCKRDDGYHNLQTLFQFINYCDYLTFTPREDNLIILDTPIKSVNNEDNLIVIAAKLLQQYVKTHHHIPPLGANISIEKNLPMGGGLGGGSSNAATTLVALNQLWQLNLSTNELITIGRKIGADVPIFIYGHNAFAQGIGDQLQSVTTINKWFLVVCPDMMISTIEIFTSPQLKRDTLTNSLADLLSSPYKNDCEPVVRALYPQIDQLINLLSSKYPTRLTGTGACIFSECENQTQAIALQSFLNQNKPENINLNSFIAQGVNQSPLFE